MSDLYLVFDEVNNYDPDNKPDYSGLEKEIEKLKAAGVILIANSDRYYFHRDGYKHIERISLAKGNYLKLLTWGDISVLRKKPQIGDLYAYSSISCPTSLLCYYDADGNTSMPECLVKALEEIVDSEDSLFRRITKDDFEENGEFKDYVACVEF